MARSLSPKAKATLGYVAFGVFAFVFWLYVTFPYDMVRTRIEREAARAGFLVQMKSLGPGVFGVVAQNVRVEKLPSGPPVEGAPATEPFVLKSVSMRPALFPPGVAFSSQAFGGAVSGSVGGLSELSVGVELDGLRPQEGNVKGALGVDLEGQLDGRVRLKVPRKNGQPAFSQANGTVTLRGKQLTVNGGTVTATIYGQPTPVDLPRIALGNLEGDVKVEAGTATLERLDAKSDDLQLSGGGTVKLADRFELSELNLELKLKTEPDFVKRLGLLGSGLSMLPTDRTDPTFRVARLAGTINNPRFNQR